MDPHHPRYGEPGAIYGQVYYASAAPDNETNKHTRPMAKIKLTISRLNPTQRVDTATKHINLCAPEPPDTPPIPNMTAPVAALTTARDAAKAANDAYESALAGLASLKTARDNTSADLGDALVQFIADAESASKGEPGPLQAGGFALTGPTNTPAVAVQVAQNLALSPGKMPGTVQGKCAVDPNAIGYEWQVTTGDAMTGPYATSTHSSGTKATLKGLTSGQRIWVRVRALGRGENGEGPWSDPATIIVP